MARPVSECSVVGKLDPVRDCQRKETKTEDKNTTIPRVSTEIRASRPLSTSFVARRRTVLMPTEHNGVLVHRPILNARLV